MPVRPAAATTEIPFSLWGQFRRHSRRYLLGLGLLALYQGAQYWFDTRLQDAINAALDERSEYAIELGVLLMLVAVGAFGVRVLSRVAIFNGGRIAEYELRKVLLEHLQKLGPSFYRKMSTGEIMSRVTNDLVQVRLLLGFAVLNVINTVFGMVSALSVMLTISAKLTLASLLPLPLLLGTTFWVAKQMYFRTRANQDAIGRLSERVQSSIAGVRVVRSFGMEQHELERFEGANNDYLEKSLSLARLRGVLGPVMQSIIALGALIVFWYGGHLMLEEQLSEGGFLAFYRALMRLTWPLMALGFLVSLVQRGRAAYSRLYEIYAAKPDIVDGPLAAPEHLKGRLEVRGLSFSYDGNPVLSDVSFALEPEESLAVVGRTGSGKSTLAVLLPRLQPTPRGSVFLDGVDVCDWPLHTVRSAIGYAQQTAFLFSTTVGRNIGYPLDRPDDSCSLMRIRDAAREASILEEVLGLPDGFDTIVGERGVQLSGGQKQRISLGRSFVATSKILILDDPLSAVDARTESAILTSIDRQRGRRGLILVTHRVSAASRCDRILVLEQGRVVEEGTHEQLLARGGLYATFAEEQRIEGELEKLGGAGLSAEEGA